MCQKCKEVTALIKQSDSALAAPVMQESILWFKPLELKQAETDLLVVRNQLRKEFIAQRRK